MFASVTLLTPDFFFKSRILMTSKSDCNLSLIKILLETNREQKKFPNDRPFFNPIYIKHRDASNKLQIMELHPLEWV